MIVKQFNVINGLQLNSSVRMRRRYHGCNVPSRSSHSLVSVKNISMFGFNSMEYVQGCCMGKIIIVSEFTTFLNQLGSSELRIGEVPIEFQ